MTGAPASVARNTAARHACNLSAVQSVGSSLMRVTMCEPKLAGTRQPQNCSAQQRGARSIAGPTRLSALTAPAQSLRAGHSCLLVCLLPCQRLRTLACGQDEDVLVGVQDCCGPILRREAPAETAEQVMRSRYSAYALGDAAWLRASMHPDNPALAGSWAGGRQRSTIEARTPPFSDALRGPRLDR